MYEFNDFVEAFQRIQEQQFQREAQAHHIIDDAVLIMNPKYKEAIAKSGIEAVILWSSECPEDKCYMVTDEDTKKEIKRNQFLYACKKVKADDDKI